LRSHRISSRFLLASDENRHSWPLSGETLVHHAGIRDHVAAPSRSQRGGGTIKAILWSAILIYGAFVAYKILPAYVAEYQLADKMQEQARFSVVNHYSDEQVRDNIFKVVKDLEIPVKREEIKVVANSDVVKISMDYTVPVDLLVYQLNLHFTPSSENKNL
jgi:hypothetical protein